MSAIRLSFRAKTYLQFACLFIGAGLLLKGCDYLSESTFTLAAESRPPRWITLPPELKRADASITMSYDSFRLGRDTIFVLQNEDKQETTKFYGTSACQPGFHLKNRPQSSPYGHSAYVPITVNGITENIEHKKMQPIFYVTDDSIVWKQYREFGCG